MNDGAANTLVAAESGVESPVGESAIKVPAAGPVRSWWGRRTPVGAKLLVVTLAFVGIVGLVLATMVLSLKISAGVRSFVTGEALWSKAQKNAAFFLGRYAQSGAEIDYEMYRRAMEVILGDRRARVELEKPAFDLELATQGFAAGGNDPLDIPQMIFLFRHFSNTPHLSKAIGIWREADARADEMTRHAEQLHAALRSGADVPDIHRILEGVRVANERLTTLEIDFSATLADGARWVHEMLLWAGLCLTVSLVFGGLFLSSSVARQLRLGLRNLQEGTRQVALGNLQYQIAVDSEDELGALARDFNHMIRRARAAASTLSAHAEALTSSRQLLAERLDFERLIMQLSSHMIGVTPQELDEGLNGALADIGAFAHVDRSYVFLFDETRDQVSCTHEWCAEGIAPQIARLRDLAVADFPWVESRLQRGEVVHVPRVSDLPPAAQAEKAEWEAESIRSILLVPMQVGRVVRGYVGFDSVRGEKAWPVEAHDVLRVFGEIVLNALNRVQAEAVLRERNETLARMVTELQRSNEELQQFAYVASHDLQEPLRSIGGFAELLQRRYNERLDESGREFVGFISASARRMHALVNDLLAYSRIDAAARPFERCAMDRVVQLALENLDASIKDAGARVTCDALPEVNGDPSQLTQLMQNLIGNAVKFRGKNPPEVHVGIRRAGEGTWEFSVSDNGIGVAAADIPRLFQIFRRLHAADRYPGAGIGLVTCKRIVERHHGRIWVEANAAGSGSTFLFTLPATGEKAAHRVSS